MRKLLANLAIAFGAIVTGFAFIPILGLLPFYLMALADTQTTSGYWRAVPTASQNIVHTEYALLLGGSLISTTGMVLRRRRRSNTA